MLNTNSSLLTLLGFGISVLLLGGFLGGTISRRQQVKEEIKEIQKQQQEVLLRIEADRKQALLNEQRALAQIDSVYQVLDALAVREGKIRGNIQEARGKVARGQDQLDRLKNDFSEQAQKSGFTLYGNQ
jgi:predicted phage-related endonuclease